MWDRLELAPKREQRVKDVIEHVQKHYGLTVRPPPAPPPLTRLFAVLSSQTPSTYD